MEKNPESKLTSKDVRYTSKSTAWYGEIGRHLQRPGAQRILTISALCKLIDAYRPDIEPAKIPAALHEILHSELLRPVTTEIMINMNASPMVDYAEIAHWLRPQSVASLSSVLHEPGNAPITVQSVIPASGKRERDSEVVIANGIKFEFYTLPAHLFPPQLEDLGDCYDYTKSYPCFTREKGLLDLLYLSRINGYADFYIPAADSSFNRSALFSLAHRMNVQELLHTHLANIPLIRKNPGITTFTSDHSGTLSAKERKEMLGTIAEIWAQNPNLNFSEILVAVKPDDSSLDLYEVSDAEWRTGIAEYQATN